MRRLRLSPSATQDIKRVLRWSEDEFGISARVRYQALIAAALRAVLEDPHRPGAQQRPEIGEGLLSYHLYLSRADVPLAVGRVRRPRHLLLYRLRGTEIIEVGRLLHDAMELSAHLPTFSSPPLTPQD